MFPLICHPQTPPLAVSAVGAQVLWLPDGKLMARYRISGFSRLVVPEFAGRGRADELWHATCCELFLASAAGDYREFNFSPSQRWAAYRFSAYRTGQDSFEPATWPEISVLRGETTLSLDASIDAIEATGAAKAGLSVVLEEDHGHLSYWALAHPDGRPDFHDAACFALPIEPAGRP